MRKRSSAVSGSSDNADDLDNELKLPGPLQRNGPLLLGIIVVTLLGPFISHRLNSYRGIVLERKEGQALLYFEYKPPIWVEMGEGEPGAVVLKEIGDGVPHRVEIIAGDYDMVQRFKLYRSHYSGEIIHIKQPAVAGGAATATIKKTDGTQVKVELWSTHFSGAAVGRKVAKQKNSWEPHLVKEQTLSLDAQLQNLDSKK